MTTSAVPDPIFGGEVEGAHVRDLSPPSIHQPEDAGLKPLPSNEIARYIGLRDEQARLSAELAEVKKHADELERQLIEAFSEAGTDSTRLLGKTVYLQRTVVASKRAGVETAQLAAALRECGLDHLITRDTVSASTLSGYVRDLNKADEPIPPPLAALINPYEKYEVRLRSTRPSGRTA